VAEGLVDARPQAWLLGVTLASPSSLIPFPFTSPSLLPRSILGGCVFPDADKMAFSFLTRLKRQDRLMGRSDADLVAEWTQFLAQWNAVDGVEAFLGKGKGKAAPKGPGAGAAPGAAAAASSAPSSVGSKRPREPEAGADGEEGNGEASSSSSSASSAQAPPASDRDPASAVFKQALLCLQAHMAGIDPSAWRASRLRRALSVYERARAPLEAGGAGLAANARTYVLLLHAALDAGEVETARSLMSELRSSGCLPLDRLYEVMQPAFIGRLTAAGVLARAEAEGLLVAEPDTRKWFFLKAAFEAMKGDQFGSKHGAVLTVGGRYASHGRNHRFAVPDDRHIRVMHSEIHALVRMPGGPEAAQGADCWIVELDGEGVGYEEAVPCPMCNKGLHRIGVAHAHYSGHAGVETVRVAQGGTGNAELACESLEAALRRTYPDSTKNPDEEDAAAAASDAAAGGSEGSGAGAAAQAASFDFASVLDPGRKAHIMLQKALHGIREGPRAGAGAGGSGSGVGGSGAAPS
jgi:pentatricopeptide repeat protein